MKNRFLRCFIRTWFFYCRNNEMNLQTKNKCLTTDLFIYSLNNLFIIMGVSILIKWHFINTLKTLFWQNHEVLKPIVSIGWSIHSSWRHKRIRFLTQKEKYKNESPQLRETISFPKVVFTKSKSFCTFSLINCKFWDSTKKTEIFA